MRIINLPCPKEEEKSGAEIRIYHHGKDFVLYKNLSQEELRKVIEAIYKPQNK